MKDLHQVKARFHQDRDRVRVLNAANRRRRAHIVSQCPYQVGGIYIDPEYPDEPEIVETVRFVPDHRMPTGELRDVWVINTIEGYQYVEPLPMETK